tara:strand:+ start:347 stop:910 length:564 start_codon:yes stop_codon:yes gene_type:complete
MKTYIPYIMLVATVTAFLIISLDYENEIEDINKELKYNIESNDSLCNIIDSLRKEIDTLEWDKQIFDFNIKINGKSLLSSIMFVESSYNDSAYNASEDAVGCLQIRQTMVNDINRILKRKGSIKRYTYEDRWSRIKSIEMFNIFCDYYGLTTAEEMARCWNGGPRGINNPATVGYWNKVKNRIEVNS